MPRRGGLARGAKLARMTTVRPHGSAAAGCATEGAGARIISPPLPVGSVSLS